MHATEALPLRSSLILVTLWLMVSSVTCWIACSMRIFVPWPLWGGETDHIILYSRNRYKTNILAFLYFIFCLLQAIGFLLGQEIHLIKPCDYRIRILPFFVAYRKHSKENHLCLGLCFLNFFCLSLYLSPKKLVSVLIFFLMMSWKLIKVLEKPWPLPSLLYSTFLRGCQMDTIFIMGHHCLYHLLEQGTDVEQSQLVAHVLVT